MDICETGGSPLMYLFILLMAPMANATSASEEAEVYQTTIWGTKVGDGLDTQRRLNRQSPGFSSAIELDEEQGARPADALPEVVARAPGATVRSIGGLGQFSAISLRGSSGQQVALFLDGVPLGGGAGGLVSLADFPLDTLKTVEIYRGYVPIAFGGASIGGAINLVSGIHRGPTRLQAFLGYGSFGSKEAGLQLSRAIGKAQSVTMRVGYSGAHGDFPFYDTNNTPLVRSDDGFSIRRNNQYDRVLGQLQLNGKKGQWKYSAQEIVLSKKQGVPGPVGLRSKRSRLSNLVLKSIFSAKKIGTFVPIGKLSLVGGFSYGQRRFIDPDNEVGVAINDERTRNMDFYLSPRLRLPLWPDAFTTIMADGRYEWVDVNNLLPSNALNNVPSGDALRQRANFGAAVQLEQFLWNARVHIAPALRVDVLRSRFQVPKGEGEQDDRGLNNTQVGFSPRLGVRYRLTEQLELRSSVGRYFRAPTVQELFGDQGFSVGNEGLLAERGTAIDAGIVLDVSEGENTAPKTHVPYWQLYVQIAGFSTWSENLIQWVRAGPANRAINVQGARVSGMELGISASAWARRLKLQANSTLLYSYNYSDDPEQYNQPLPGRPRYSTFARLSFGDIFHIFQEQTIARAFYSAEYISGTFLDPSGRVLVPARTIHGVGIEMLVGTVRLALELRNLNNARRTTWTPPVGNAGSIPVPISDFIGYPLPGRSVWLSLQFNHELGSGEASS